MMLRGLGEDIAPAPQDDTGWNKLKALSFAMIAVPAGIVWWMLSSMGKR